MASRGMGVDRRNTGLLFVHGIHGGAGEPADEEFAW